MLEEEVMKVYFLENNILKGFSLQNVCTGRVLSL